MLHDYFVDSLRCNELLYFSNVLSTVRDVGLDCSQYTTLCVQFVVPKLTLTINISYSNYTFQFSFGCNRDSEFVRKVYTALHFLLNVTGMNFCWFFLSSGWVVMIGSIKDQIDYIKLCSQLIFILFLILEFLGCQKLYWNEKTIWSFK